MFKITSLKAYVLFWVTFLALCLTLLLTYQSTQYFLKGLDLVTEMQMIRSADQLPEGQQTTTTVFRYHVASSWEYVPEEVRATFVTPPKEHFKLYTHFEDWWYFSPPGKGYFLLSAYNKDNQLRFVSLMFTEKKKPDNSDEPFELDPMVVIALWGLGGLLIFIILIYRIFGKLAKPVQSVSLWAQQLRLESLSQPVPDFQYAELNELAKVIHRNLTDVNAALEREKEFLGYASHELRTPIATLRSNATLLDKVNPDPGSKEREVRDRILRSSLTMKGITETLLWLSRDDKQPIRESELSIDETLQLVINELDYLLVGKEITVEIHTESCTKQLPEAAFRILLTNIIRNAFQHTQRGTIKIKQTASSIQIVNSMASSQGQASTTGYGLGLKLIRKIVERFHWQLNEEKTDETYNLTVNF